ncbi:hypothetical protein Fmac_009694 [Flemingia macrophylla]|uniref:C2 domain-containing protein n=1 Tax=Flemingia macrophylla TaxID=520843 RepID=A0ABD1N117_9FABA
MEYRTLELNIVSAKDLKNVNVFSKMDAYAVVSLSGDPLHPQAATTHVHKDAGTNPTWNYPAKFSVNKSLAEDNRLSLEIKLISDRTLAGDTVIGTVHIPLREFLDEPGSFSQVVYPVRTSSGKPKGTLYLSYKFGDHVTAPSPAPAAKSALKEAHDPVMAYPPSNFAPGTGTSSVPSATPYVPPPQQQYAAPATGYGYPPQSAYGGYPPQPGYGYPQQPGYGYPPQTGYGYPQAQKPKKNKMGLGLGAGLLGGALGGMLIGDMVSDAAAYDAGYDAGFDDAGFDF